MTNCYWGKCDCPDRWPCAQHDGFFCSVHNGTLITSLDQINDAVTAGLEAAVADLHRDTQSLSRLKTELEQQKSALEREREEFERDIADANSYAKRRAVFTRAQQAANRYNKQKDDLSNTLTQIDDIVLAPQRAISLLLNHLIVPYYDSTGYCSCYQAKVGRLNALSSLLTSERITLANLQTQYGLAAAGLRVSLAATIGYTIVLTVIVIGILWFGWGFSPLLFPFLSYLGNFITLIVLCITVNNIGLQIVTSKKTIANLMLRYYRLQEIPTCRKEHDLTDEEWWEEFFKGDWLPESGF